MMKSLQRRTAILIVKSASMVHFLQNTVYDDLVSSATVAPTEADNLESDYKNSQRKKTIRRAPPANFDPKCNSDTLKALILKVGYTITKLNMIHDTYSSQSMSIQTYKL